MLAIGQERGNPVDDLPPRGVDGCNFPGHTASLRHAPDGAGVGAAEEHGTIRIPRPGSQGVGHLAKRLWRAAVYVESLKLSSVGKRDRAAIGRPEELRGVFSPRQAPPFRRLEIADPYSKFSNAGGVEGQLSAIR